MKIDVKILDEITRYKKINNYVLEQAAPPPLPTGEETPTDTTPAPPSDIAAPAPPTDTTTGTTEPQKVDLKTDTEVEKVGDEGKRKKEIEVTDLVKSQKNIQTKQEDYFENLFKSISNLEEKLSDMDKIMDKLNSLEMKVEKYRVKSPEEKMQLRTLDSGPYNQKLTDFFQDKESEFEKTGKEQYKIGRAHV